MTDEPNKPAPTQADLLPCPFCGGEASFEHLENGRWSVGCNDVDGDCMGFQMLQSYPRQIVALNAWNARAQPAQPEAGEPVAETAWLIERHDLATIDSRNEVCLHYYAEWPTGKHYWTPDHMKAKRFPNEAAARMETNGDPLLSVVEHMWHAHPIAEAGGVEKLRGPVYDQKMPTYNYQTPNYRSGGSVSATPPAPADLVKIARELLAWYNDYPHTVGLQVGLWRQLYTALQRPARVDREAIAPEAYQRLEQIADGCALEAVYGTEWCEFPGAELRKDLRALLHPAQEATNED